VQSGPDPFTAYFEVYASARAVFWSAKNSLEQRRSFSINTRPAAHLLERQHIDESLSVNLLDNPGLFTEGAVGKCHEKPLVDSI